jgi:hypothetical protein
MEFVKATYSYKALMDCVDAIKACGWTVKHKAEHTWKCYNDVQKVFDLCYEKTGCVSFRLDWALEWEDYTKAIERKATKQELDMCLRRCELLLKREINEIRTMMETGEVNSID